MFQKDTTVKNPTGLHARPASQLTQFCKKFDADIEIINGATNINPKSIIAILASGLKSGTPITVRVTGSNEEIVCNQIVDFIESLTE